MNLFVLQVISEAKVNLTVWGFIPGDPFPENTTIRDGKLVLESYCIVLWILQYIFLQHICCRIYNYIFYLAAVLKNFIPT